MATDFSRPTPNEMPWLIRADFTDQPAWEQVCRAILVDPDQPDEDAQIGFVVVEDIDLEGLTPARLLELDPHGGVGYFLVDGLTMSHPDRPLVAVDTAAESLAFFRLVPSAVQSFAVNMLVANMDFDDFADNVDADGIFRDFGNESQTAPAGMPRDAPREQDVPTGSNRPYAPTGAISPIADLIREAKPDEPNSFVGELLRGKTWNPASWQRLEAGMREACVLYSGAAEVPRAFTEAFHSVLVRVPNLAADPEFLAMGMDPAGLDARLDRIRMLSAWFFRGWAMDRPDGPLPGEYDPNASHG